MDRIRAWVSLSDRLHEDFLPLHAVLLSKTFACDQHSALRHLSTASLRSTASVLILLENFRHWDAELVLRSVQEATIKFVYLVSDPRELAVRLNEFSEDLFEIASIKRHDRATEAIAIYAKAGITSSPALSALLLDKAAYDSISVRYPGKLRQQLEGRWGFTRLIDSLARQQSPVAHLFPTLLHGYGMASHLHHADSVGIGMVAERESRPEPGRSSVMLAHIARMVSDCNTYSFMRLITAYSCVGNDGRDVHEVWQRHQAGFSDLLEAQAEWNSLEFP